jgi:Iap family predicted aminopeptidase
MAVSSTRYPAVAFALALTTAALSGCAPAPEPSPTPTPAFASDEEAFAAAEEVYRAYIDAVNAENRGDNSTKSFDFLTGTLLESELQNRRELDASGVHIEGDTVVLSFLGDKAKLDSVSTTITGIACLDISAARAFDEDGNDVTAAGRSNVYSVVVTLVESGSSLLISQYEVGTGTVCES